ncbi:MAG: hypothetical protein FWF44_04130, partial [Defluviitaleaceae bacterium]|nr:hypothetical protein [Defluviitaleaceae bacterium]
MRRVKKGAALGKFRIFTFIFGFTRPFFGYYFPASLVYGGQQVFFVLISSYLMGGLTGAISGKSLPHAVRVIWVASVAVVLSMLLIGVAVYLYVMATARTERRMKRAIFRAFLRQSVEAAGHSGEGVAAINTDADTAGNL